MKSNVYMMLEKFFDETMINLAKKFGYEEDNIIILESDENKLKSKYPETYMNLVSCEHNRDSRTAIEYAQDLICSWIFEDYLLYNLKLNGLNIELSGNDKNRKILKSSKVSSSSDYLISFNDSKAYLELASDYTGYWERKGVCDLRDNKWEHLKKMKVNNDYSLLLGIDFNNSKFFIIDTNTETDVIYIPFHYAYKKPVYSIKLNQENFFDLDFNKICEIIKNIMSEN